MSDSQADENSTAFQSWGRFPQVSQRVLKLRSRDERLPTSDTSFLPYGQGRSYGDSCLNNDGSILSTNELDNFIDFDQSLGVLRVESGVTLDKILQVIVPRGWFIPVSPGTRFVSIGGAIANDIHGKNHHVGGTFGRHVLRFELLRSTGERLLCSPTENSELFSATIAGLGLTGLILWAEIQLRKIESPFIDMDSIKFGSLDEFFEISSNSSKEFEYTVAWLDCLASGDSFGRGIFMRGNHAPHRPGLPRLPRAKGSLLRVPFNAPEWILNPLSMKAFNFLYYNRLFSKLTHSTVYYQPFFYPLDSVGQWNRIYGKRGFLQFQCVVPRASGNQPIKDILNYIVQSRQASFLAVLKEFGSHSSPGMLSFPRPGVTLCLDFANRGPRTLELLRELDRKVLSYGGAIYPAKDATMAASSFKTYFPAWQEFTKHIDPAFSSSFWRRVTAA